MEEKPQQIDISGYDYPLPESRIAKQPLKKRDMSKLLVYKGGEISETVFRELPGLIPPRTLVVTNKSKVINARIFMQKPTGASIEVLCVEPVEPGTHVEIFKQKGRCMWNCYVGNLSKWKEGKISCNTFIAGKRTTLEAELKGASGDLQLIEFTWNNDNYNFGRILEIFGSIPIPPYLNRDVGPFDMDWYQTIYAGEKGSVAAPTAGLHFTEEVVKQFAKRYIYQTELTLHVSAATFKPVQAPTLAGHEMHAEWIFIDSFILQALLLCPGRIVAIGTTTTRALESLYYIGVLISRNPESEPQDLVVGQWMPYDPENNRLSVERSLKNIQRYMKKRNIERLVTTTRILIAPGYEFKFVTGLVTNFHQPHSTLLLLVSAFVKGDWKRIYDYALAHDFRFLSYGDSSFLLSDAFEPSTIPPPEIY